MRPGSFSLNKKDKKKRPMVLKVQRIPVTPKFVFLISIYGLRVGPTKGYDKAFIPIFLTKISSLLCIPVRNRLMQRDSERSDDRKYVCRSHATGQS